MATKKAPAKPKLKGRPSTYNPEVAKSIIEQLSDGIPLRVICRQEGMPAWRTMYDWIAKDEELSAHIARARELGFDAIAQECLVIADTPLEGVEVEQDADGKTTKTKRGDMLGHRKLQIETRLKLLAKWDPKRYGDRIHTEHSGSIGTDMDDEQLDRLIRERQQAVEKAGQE